MNEYKLRKDYQNINKSILDKIATIVQSGSIANPKPKEAINEFMKKVDYDYCNSLCEFIASIFNVNRAEILSYDKRSDITHARWAYWYTLCYSFKRTYREIAIMSSLEGEIKDVSTIRKGIDSLQFEMKTNPMLRSKISTIKQLIYIGEHPNSYDTPFSDAINRDIHVMIKKPKGVSIDVIEDVD